VTVASCGQCEFCALVIFNELGDVSANDWKRARSNTAEVVLNKDPNPKPPQCYSVVHRRGSVVKLGSFRCENRFNCEAQQCRKNIACVITEFLTIS